MADKKATGRKRQLTVRHRGRIPQIGIFFIKFLRLFFFQSDWIMLPVAALIGGIVGFVISSYFMVTMEGTMTGAFVLVCICVWIGCFNSIQSICREREVVKREHRSGMYISSYVIAHMLYQLLLCLIQTILILVVTHLSGVKYPDEGLLTKWFLADFGITILLITYAADMMSLWISSLAKTTTAAMTVMPFVLVFQLVFSGGMIPLPEVAKPVAALTVACPGFNAMASQADTNSKPYGSTVIMLRQVEGMNFEMKVTVGQILTILKDTDNESVLRLRSKEISQYVTVGDILSQLMTSNEFRKFRGEEFMDGVTVGMALTLINEADFMDKYREQKVGGVTTVGEVVDLLAEDESMKDIRSEEIVVSTTVGEAMKLIGKKDTEQKIKERATRMNYHSDYEHSLKNIIYNWLDLGIFIIVFSILTIITLQFVDKDKR